MKPAFDPFLRFVIRGGSVAFGAGLVGLAWCHRANIPLLIGSLVAIAILATAWCEYTRPRPPPRTPRKNPAPRRATRPGSASWNRHTLST